MALSGGQCWYPDSRAAVLMELPPELAAAIEASGEDLLAAVRELEALPQVRLAGRAIACAIAVGSVFRRCEV